MVNRADASRGLFIAWETYQRRAELLAPLLGAELALFPNRMPRRSLRPIDYAAKLVGTIAAIRRRRPHFAIAQAPPHFSALAPWWMDLPFVLDAHNGLFQSYWGRLPLAPLLLRRAEFVLVHNDEILEHARRAYPEVDFLVMSDPLRAIRFPNLVRRPEQILFASSFDGDEPLETIVSVVERAQSYEFVITANPDKLPTGLRRRLLGCRNARLTGYLSVEDYQRTLCSSAATIALTETPATQQSGACEALSSNTPLIVSRSALSERLFGDWASLVENTPDAVLAGLRSLGGTPLQLEPALDSWNARIEGQAKVVAERLGGSGEAGR